MNPKAEAFQQKFKVWLKYWDEPTETSEDDTPAEPGT